VEVVVKVGPGVEVVVKVGVEVGVASVYIVF
jgi:hypothetical protein